LQVIILSDALHLVAATAWEAPLNYHKQNEPEEDELYEHPDYVCLSIDRSMLISLDRIAFTQLIGLSVAGHGLEYLRVKNHRTDGALHWQDLAVLEQVITEILHRCAESDEHSDIG